MKQQYTDITNRIYTELDEIKRVLEKIEQGWNKARQSNDTLYIDSVALNLHAFYSGLERIFELIATRIDGLIPEGERWHKRLLGQMATEMQDIRPAVISEDVFNKLCEYLGFRHVVRNVYTFMFDVNKLENLVLNVNTLFIQIKEELSVFIDFIDKGSMDS